jgi:hypothetical protein
MPEDDRPIHLHGFRCRACGNRFTVKRLTADSSKVKIPKCPRKSCGGKSKASYVPDIGFDAAEGKAPAVGGSLSGRAFDYAMQTTMADHGMTDIKDTVRPGETSVPPLPPRLQQQADSFWNPKQAPAQRRGRVDLSGLYGPAANQGAPPPGVQTLASGAGHPIAPILNSRPTGSSPIPAHTIIGGDRPGGAR